MKQTQNIDFQPHVHEWDEINLVISDEIRLEMEQKFISIEEIKEAIWQAETTGDRFHSVLRYDECGNSEYEDDEHRNNKHENSRNESSACANIEHSNADNLYLASLVKPVITYWVEYRIKAENTYEVTEAYYHRMRFVQEN